MRPSDEVVDGSRVNAGEARVCAEVVEGFVRLGLSPSEIAVIAPYRAQ